MKLPTVSTLTSILSDPSAEYWERPSPDAVGFRRDVMAAVALTVVGMVFLVLAESFAGVSEGNLEQGNSPRWWGYALIAGVMLPLCLRRRYPLLVFATTTLVFFGGSYLAPMAIAQVSTQVGYAVALYTLVAWGKNRHIVAVALIILVIGVGLWLVVDLTISATYREYVANLGASVGPLDPYTAFVLYAALVSVGSFGAMIYAGQASWRGALHRHRLREQSRTIEHQSQELTRRAVVEERLRIARELHDVIAHHISAIGIQAGAARTILGRDPDGAQQALRTVEASSRQAVAETRQLLGVLREGESRDVGSGEYGVADLEDLVREYAARGLTVTLTWAVDEASSLERLPLSAGLAIYRCVQESLTNVLRHSTARQVSVVVRTLTQEEGACVELEVLDRGRPVTGQEGGGYGLVGIRERVHMHAGTCEIGARSPGPGWRVRVTIPYVRSVEAKVTK